jgi:hypothetical protein
MKICVECERELPDESFGKLNSLTFTGREVVINRLFDRCIKCCRAWVNNNAEEYKHLTKKYGAKEEDPDDLEVIPYVEWPENQKD